MLQSLLTGMIHHFKSSKLCVALGALVLMLSQPGSADIKVASVDIDKILLHYQDAAKQLSYLKAGRDRYLISRNERQKQVNELALEIKAIYAKLKNKAMPRSERNHLMGKQEELIRQYQKLTEEIIESDDLQITDTKRKITIATRDILNDCSLVINDYAMKQGYQWVIETSGTTSSTISPLLYARDAVDITDEILTLLNKDESP